MKTDPRFPKLHIVDHPLVQHKLSTMREKKTPSNSFRQLLRELTYLIGYEVTRDLPLETRTIDTPLCKCKGNFIKGNHSDPESWLRYVRRTTGLDAVRPCGSYRLIPRP